MNITYPTFKILHYKKTGYKQISAPNDLSCFVIKFSIDRRYGTNINQASIMFNNTGNIQNLFKLNPVKDSSVLDNVDKIQILINNTVQFTGFLTDYKVSADKKTVEATIHDNLWILKKGANFFPRLSVKFYQVSAIGMINYLSGLAGTKIEIDNEINKKDYIMDTLEVQTGSIYYDVISDICESLNCRLFCTKEGTNTVKPMFDGIIPSKLDFKYDDVEHITNGSRQISSSLLNPTILITNENKKNGFMFRDKIMYDYLNNWDSVLKVDNKFAVNKYIAQNVASYIFKEMWRKSLTTDAISANGNINMDVGKIGSANFDNYFSTYIVVGLTTSFNMENGYTDTLEMQDATINPQIQFLGELTECGSIRQQIVDQARKYKNVPFQPNAYYRKEYGEWGMRDEALITRVLIDLKMKSPDQLTASQNTIKYKWCIPIDASKLKPGDIVTWRHDLSEMGFYTENKTIIEVWGSILRSNTETAMRKHGYVVKEINMPKDKQPVCWRLKELENCE